MILSQFPFVDGTSTQIGRIEIQYNGVWGTICDRSFDINSANVACRSLGFIAALRLVPTIGSGTGQIWLNNVRCLGNETSLEQCPHDGFGNHNCNHYLDIGVECIGKTFYNMHSYIHIFLLHDLSSQLLLLSLYDYILK